MSGQVACRVDSDSDGSGWSLVVEAPALATALRVADRCPFVLQVDSSLLFCFLTAPGATDIRPTFVFVFGGQSRADLRGSAVRMLEGVVDVLFIDSHGAVPAVGWTVVPRSGSDGSSWRDNLLTELGFL